MEAKLKDLMLSFKLSCESSLFKSDLRFKLADDSSAQMLLSQPGFKADDSLFVLNQKLSSIITEYEAVLKEIIDRHSATDSESEVHVSVALYVACYFDEGNQHSIEFAALNSKDPNFNAFVTEWRRAEFLKVDLMKESQRAKLKNPEAYKFISKTIESKPLMKLKRFIAQKKLFSIPWLLAHQVLFEKRDFL